MTEFVSTARSAREALARGLSALQSDPNVPAEFLDLAEPIALAMGALHRIERSEGPDIRTHADVALNQVRASLSKLQEKPASHPAIVAAMEAVASSLGLVHSLTKAAETPVATTASIPRVDELSPVTAPLPKAAQAQQAPQGPSNAALAATVQALPQQFAPAQGNGPAQNASSAATFRPQGGPVHHPNQAPAAPPTAPPPVGYAPDPFGGGVHGYGQGYGHGYGQGHAAPAGQHGIGAPPRPHAPQPGPRLSEPEPILIATPGVDPSLPLMNADLGAHSMTNFYKGLSGNDIIEHGGIFVSTYKSPPLGTAVRLRVSLPGGYEFEAQATIRWRRENEGEGEGATPGFGAQFTNISAEAKQLVYRYVRNREPLFHDDL